MRQAAYELHELVVCSVVADWDCKAAANRASGEYVKLGQCYQCGNEVCTSKGCSRKLSYWGSPKKFFGTPRRLCMDCIQADHDMTGQHYYKQGVCVCGKSRPLGEPS